MFRQELVTIQTTGDHLSDAVIPEALADFLQSGEGRFRIAQPVHRIIAAIENQADPLVQLTAQDVPDLADQSRPVCGQTASRPEDRIRTLVKRKGESMSGFCEPAGAVQRLPDRQGIGSCLNKSAALPQKKRRMATDSRDKPRRTGGRRCSKKRPPDAPKESGPAFRTPPERGRRPYRRRSRDIDP